jgi:ubiquinone/menaquinone biosynthesis C-methylase UbiE
MAFYRDRVYPHIVSALGNPKPIDEIRRRIVPLAEGNVLEIGVGPGVNFPYYDPHKVNKVYALEPNPGMLPRAEKQRRRTQLDVEFIDLPGESIPLGDSTIDTTVSTFTMCTIARVVEALRGVGRVLKPGGQLIFFEHGLSPDPQVQGWQRRIEPFSKWALQGCHVTRHIPTILKESGFNIEQLNEGYMAPFPKSSTYCFWGVARYAA